MEGWLIDHVLWPLLGSLAGGAGGYLVAALRFKKRIGDVEDKVDGALEMLNVVELRREAMHSGWKLQFEAFREDVARLEVAFDRRENRESHHDLAKEAELARFITEDRERWETVQRFMGKMEALLGLEPSLVPRPAPRKR